ncbi:endonuclease domain-containing protein [Roseomonas aeriglobus]|nr:endonuclease domain-containing protein [Roseomonas aeriglobus]
MRNNPTEGEVRVWRHLSGSQPGFKFRRQAVIVPYICDFLCPAKGPVVEVDGETHDVPYDARRYAYLLAKGYRTLRFSNRDVRNILEGVILTIADAVRTQPDRWSGRPHPDPSPEGEGMNVRRAELLPFQGGAGAGGASQRPHE